MKKDSIKNFAKKVLTVGFCVPVAFVCSAIPAMAADTASTGGGTAYDTSVVEPQSTSTTGETQTKESSKVVTPQAVPEKQPSVTETKTDNNNGTPETTVQAASASTDKAAAEDEQQKTVGDKILGEAKNYGIVCNKYSQVTDAQTNIAAKKQGQIRDSTLEMISQVRRTRHS